MNINNLYIPDDLMHLRPTALLESISMSKLARSGSEVLRGLVEKEQPVAVKIQGQGAMVTLTQHQYDEVVELIHNLKSNSSNDSFTRHLSDRFDHLMTEMNQPGTEKIINEALFSDATSLNKTYRPGRTEDKV